MEKCQNENINKGELEKLYFGTFDSEAYEKAFQARLAYEKNCIAKYDYPGNRPSRPVKKGETMDDFACKYGTTVKEMKNCERQVEEWLKNNP